MPLYQHFNKEEQQFIDKILDIKQRSQDTYIPQLTGFLNPREAYIVQSLFSKSDDVTCYFLPCEERTRAVISYPLDDIDFQVSVLTIEYPKKFAVLKHSGILGTLLSTGLKKETIGDIITNGTDWQVVVDTAIAPYIMQNVHKIGGITVTLKNSDSKITNVIETFQWDEQLMTSLRLDSVIASFFNMSRQSAKVLVESGQVTINWKNVIKADTVVNLYDTVSVRKYGRIIYHDDLGQTKKGKFKIRAKVLTNKR